MPEELSHEYRELLRRYKQDCERTFDFVGFLGYSGERNRLPREKCFIGRATLDAASDRKQKEEKKLKAAIGANTDPAEAADLLKDEELIDRLRTGKLKRVYITGEGGIGKTEYTRLIAYRLVKSLNVDRPRAVPVRFELKDLTKAYDNGEKFFQRRVAPASHLWLTKLADAGKVVFIFDGLDEVGIDRSDFNFIFKTLVERFPDCSFVLTARPGPLGDLDVLFPDSVKHELKPLEIPQIRFYITGYFACRNRPDLAPRLMGDIQSKRGSLFPLIQSPFMLAFACDRYYAPDEKVGPTGSSRRELPSNPAELIESGLKRMFGRRRHDKRGPRFNLPKSDDLCLEALSTLAAFMLLEPKPGEAIRLTFSSNEAEGWLLQNRVFFECPEIGYALPHDGKAKALLSRLAPHCGVLIRTEEDKFTFTNRVVAEFLAARWIVRHGYPNWPYDMNNPNLQYTHPVVRTETISQRRDRQIMDFLGDHIWTLDRDGLVQAVRFELGRDPSGRAQLMRFVQWACKHIEFLFPLNQELCLDLHLSLIASVFRTFRALHDSDNADQLTQITSIAHRFFPPFVGWWRYNSGVRPWSRFDSTVESVQCLPASCKKGYSEVLAEAMSEALVGTGRDEDDERFEVTSIIRAIVSGVAHDVDLQEQSDNFVCKFLEKATENPHKWLDQVVELSRAITSSRVLDPTVMRQIRGILLAAWETANADPRRNWRMICALAKEITPDSSADAHLTRRVHEALSAALTITRVTERSGLSDVVTTVLLWFPSDAELKQKCFEALLAASKAAYNDPSEGQFFGSFIGDWASVMVSDLAADAQSKETVRDALLEALNALASKDLNKHAVAIDRLYSAIRSDFEGDPALMQRAQDVFSATWDAAYENPTENSFNIWLLERTIASDPSADTELKKCARNALWSTFEAVSRQPKIFGSGSALSHLATSITADSAADAMMRQRVLNGLIGALQAEIVEEEVTGWGNISTLLETLVSCFPGNLRVASAVIYATYRDKLICDQWKPFVVLYGWWEPLCQWAGPRGDNWGLTESEQIIERIRLRDSDNANSIKAVLVAPREKIRRGLSAELLSKVVAEESALFGTSLDAAKNIEPQTAFPPVSHDNAGSISAGESLAPSAPSKPVISQDQGEKLYVFRRLALQRWEMAFGMSSTKEIPFHRVGFMHLARLLERPGILFPDTGLRLSERPDLAAAESAQGSEPIIDREAYEALLSYRDELLNIEKHGGLEQAEEARERRQQIERKLQAVKTRSGKLRKIKSPSEQAQTTVGNALKDAYKCLREQGLREMAGHLEKHVEAHRFCHFYRAPEPMLPWAVTWLLPEDNSI